VSFSFSFVLNLAEEYGKFVLEVGQKSDTEKLA